jgi:hypothetical protein
MTHLISRLTLFSLLLFAAPGAVSAQMHGSGFVWKDVSGTAIHYFDEVDGRGVIVHSVQPTANGVRQRSTDTIELFGDLEGRVLYHPVTVINEAAGTLTNRGNQVFSGTVLGSAPVLLHDDAFRFDVNLATGETTGKVRLMNRIAGPLIRCRLDIVGTGFTPEGNGLAEYSGRCRMPRDLAPEEGW